MKKLIIRNASTYMTNIIVMRNQTEGYPISEVIVFKSGTGEIISSTNTYILRHLGPNIDHEWDIKNKMIKKRSPDWKLDAFIMTKQDAFRNDRLTHILYLSDEFLQLEHKKFELHKRSIEQILNSKTLNIEFTRVVRRLKEKQETYFAEHIDPLKKSLEYSTGDNFYKLFLDLEEKVSKWIEIKNMEDEHEMLVWQEIKEAGII